MALKDFFVDTYTTRLNPDEILTQIEVPPLPPGYGSVYLRVHRLQRPTLGIAAAVKMREESLEDVRLAVGCVGPKPERLEELERSLRGLELAEAQRLIEDRKSYFRDLLRPVDDLLGSVEYKIFIVRVLLKRALSDAAALAGSGNHG
jgi:CO/xanthine dehydrogenase FAD-binding subunit